MEPEPVLDEIIEVNRTSFPTITSGRARWAWTKRLEVVIGIDPGTVAIGPMKFYRVVSYGANVDQFRIWNRDKLARRAVTLA